MLLIGDYRINLRITMQHFLLICFVFGLAATMAMADCYTFYEGLCPGPSNCMCTLGEPCGGGSSSSGDSVAASKPNASLARSASGGCSGYCRTVASGYCPGDSSCLYDDGPCGGGSSGSGSNPSPPSPPSPPSGEALGGDVSSLFSSSAYSCAVQGGWSFVIVRSYCSYGAPDPNALANLQAAKAGGMSATDIYHFPCAGSDAATQVQDDVNAVSGNFGTLWFDIETNPSSGCGWSGDVSSNCNFLQSMIAAGQSLGISMGVYSSAYMWSSIMGDSCTAGADQGLPLWYAHYDGARTFSDFSPFGGWSTPSMKQYNDNSAIGSNCGISADADYYA